MPPTSTPSTERRTTAAEREYIREHYPKCFLCGGSIRVVPLSELVPVAGRNRLTHRVCAEREAHELSPADRGIA